MKNLRSRSIIFVCCYAFVFFTACEKESLPTIKAYEPSPSIETETYSPKTDLSFKEELVANLEKDSIEHTRSGGEIQTRSFSTNLHGRQVYIRAKHSGKVLDVVFGSLANGANVQQFRPKSIGYNNQKFKLLAAGDGTYYIQNMNSRKFLDVANGSKAAGANVQQYRFHGGNNQRFLIIQAGPREYYIMNKHSRKFLDVAGRSTSDGANVQQYWFNGGSNQIFSFIGAIITT